MALRCKLCEARLQVLLCEQDPGLPVRMPDADFPPDTMLACQVCLQVCLLFVRCRTLHTYEGNKLVPYVGAALPRSLYLVRAICWHG